jgi:hypothetical protein
MLLKADDGGQTTEDDDTGQQRTAMDKKLV